MRLSNLNNLSYIQITIARHGNDNDVCRPDTVHVCVFEDLILFSHHMSINIMIWTCDYKEEINILYHMDRYSGTRTKIISMIKHNVSINFFGCLICLTCIYVARTSATSAPRWPVVYLSKRKKSNLIFITAIITVANFT